MNDRKPPRPRVRAPELPENFTWLNTDKPLQLKQLRDTPVPCKGSQSVGSGCRHRIILLDFWTYCCINCIHVLPDLKYLERKYRDVLTVIGVHCGKFDNEKDVENVRNAILKYDIEHPIILDEDFYLWQQYTIRAYPSFIVINQDGYIVAQMSGEGNCDKLDRIIRDLYKCDRGSHSLHSGNPYRELEYRNPINSTHNPENYQQYRLEKDRQACSDFLKFPGDVLATSIGLFIADSGNHRLIWQNYDGETIDIIGNGQPGLQDGYFHQAEFNSPQGIEIDEARRVLYIADTGNHAIRQIDLETKTVKTIAGTGCQNRNLAPQVGIALNIPLNSPWDVVLLGESLFIAMAGCHQIWQLDLHTQQIQTFAGSGAEGCVDGDVIIAAFAQPSGITSDGQVLYIADSETSTIRFITLTQPVEVGTVCGSGDLYGFGDRDGVGEYVRLQHPLDVEYYQGYLWIADTYNHKIKGVNPRTGECEAVILDEEIKLAEPSGLSVWDSRLYIADTNQHRVIGTNWGKK